MVDAVSLLIANGHREVDILAYPLEKFEMYLKSISRFSASRRAEGVMDTAVSIASSLTGKGMKEYLEELMESVDG